MSKADSSQTKTILLVEDEALIALSEARTLQKLGYNLMMARNGTEAITAIRNAPEIDLVLMDINLGDEPDGTHTAETILTMRELPIIFMSSHTERAVVERTEGITSYGYIVKGSNEIVLDTSIRMAFRLYEAHKKERAKDEALRASEKQLRLITEQMSDVIFVTDTLGTVTYLSPAAEQLFRVPVTGLIGQPFPQFLAEAEIPKAFAAFQQAIYQGKPTRNLELKMKRKDGTLFTGEVSAAVYQDDGTVGTIGVLRDVTQRKQAEAALQKAYQERQALLRELQHRAKNSFALITSLATLMADSSPSPNTRKALLELSERVSAMAELYDLIYVTESVTETRLDDYCTRIVASLPSSTNIRFEQAYESLLVPVKRAASIGLIFTELITNAIKHAFPNGQHGRIQISLCKSDLGGCIEVADNGTGLPEGFDIQNSKSLGLAIIRSLTQQINGQFNITSNARGTICRLEFPLF